MTERKSFEDRLAEMAGGTRDHGTSKPFVTLADDTAEKDATPRRRRGGLGLKLLLATGLMLVFGTGVMAFMQGKIGNVGPAVSGMNLAGVFDFLPKKEQPAWTYLPPAPDGWIAVTPDDAERDVQASIDTVAQRYPGGEEALRAHPAFQDIGRYLDLEGRPSGLLVKKTPLTKGKVLYVHPADGVFLAELELRREDRVLGFADTPEGWQDALARMAEDNKKTGAKIERLMFQSYPAVNLIEPIFGDLTPAKLDLKADVFTQMSLSVALNHRTILKISGAGQPSIAAKLTDAMDATALLDRVTRLTGATPSLTSRSEPTGEPGLVSRVLTAPAEL